MIIEVNESHIQNGTREHSCDCPVAKALTERFPEHSFGIYVWVLGRRDDKICIGNIFYTVPRSVKRFVKKYDKTGQGMPFRFKLERVKEN